MKKTLLNFKFLFLSLLFCTTFSWSQTIFQENFGSAVVPVANNYVGGTSTPVVNYTTNIPGYSAVGIDANNSGYLNFVSNGIAKRVSVSGDLPTGTDFNNVLHSNTKLITWTLNMKSSRLSTNQFSATTGYPETKYFNATVLCASNNSFISNGTTPGTGYAVVVQKSTADVTKASINLIKFSNGLGDAAAGSAEASVLTRLIESPGLAPSPTSAAPNNLSIKVTYNPSIDVWELYYREDAGTVFVDPTSGTLNLGGSFTQVPPTTPMTSFGYVVGLQTSTSAQNSFQFDNFQIALSPLPAYTAPPVIEKRQAFNSALNPKVSDLVATGTAIKWYSTLTGGSALATTDALSYTTYFGSQTINGTESTRVATQVFVGDTALKTLPFYEGFEGYNLADKLVLMNNDANAAVATNNGVGLGSWSITPSTNITDDVTIVAAPVWTKIVNPKGNAITFAGSGIDPELKFTNTTSGNLFSSFVFTAADVATIVASTTTDPAYSTPTGFYSFLSTNIDPVTAAVTNSYSSDVMFRKNMTTGKFNIGLSKSNNITECVWSPTEYDFNTEHVVVISYENIGNADASLQTANLWIDPATSTQPTATLSQNNPTTSVTRDHIDSIKLVQASSTSTPTLIVDEIRVANTWSDVNLALPTVNASQLKMYPNPVSNGKLFISSATDVEKEVVIYNTLGQKVLQAKTSTEAINVSSLTHGTYFVKINEAGYSATKKLIVQ